MSEKIFIIGGIFWLLAYIEIIRIGFRDKSFAMPIFAFSLNISWEFIYSFIYPPSNAQLYVNILWFFLDLIILVQIILYWKNDYSGISEKVFYPAFIILFLLNFTFLMILNKEFGTLIACFYSAFGMNLVMSLLFITMFSRRRSLRGQSVFIAAAKLMGTLFSSIGYFNFAPEIKESSLMYFFYITIFLFDLIYLALLLIQKKKNYFFPSINYS